MEKRSEWFILTFVNRPIPFTYIPPTGNERGLKPIAMYVIAGHSRRWSVQIFVGEENERVRSYKLFHAEGTLREVAIPKDQVSCFCVFWSSLGENKLRMLLIAQHSSVCWAPFQVENLTLVTNLLRFIIA